MILYHIMPRTLCPPFQCGTDIYSKNNFLHIVTIISDGAHAIVYFSKPFLRPIIHHMQGGPCMFLSVLCYGLGHVLLELKFILSLISSLYPLQLSLKSLLFWKRKIWSKQQKEWRLIIWYMETSIILVSWAIFLKTVYDLSFGH